jgi:hypothetical protein
VQVLEKAGEAAATHHDGVVDFVLERLVEIARCDAEILTR